MAKVRLDADIESISGRLSKNSNVTYVTSSKTGKCYRKEANRKPYDPKTETQKVCRSDFSRKAAVASEWWQVNNPKKNGGTVTDEWLAMVAAYDAQDVYGNMYTFVRANVGEGYIVRFN